MFLFIRLVLAHLLADFPLQFDLIYRLKMKGVAGQAFHAGIFTCVALIISWLYLNLPLMWAFLLFLGLVHFGIDSAKAIYIDRRSDNVWTFCLDQLFHLAIISTVFLTDLSSLPIPKGPHPYLARLYYNNLFMLFIIGYTITTFGADALLDSIRKTFQRYFTHPRERYYGLIERAVITTLLIPDGGYWLLIFPILLIRVPAKVTRPFAHIILSTLLAIAVGLYLKRLL